MVKIIMIHGLGGHTWSFSPLSSYLQEHRVIENSYCLFDEIICISYPSRELTISESTKYINDALLDIYNLDPLSEELMIIGQSLGGLIGSRLHEYGWCIRLLITVCSPMRGARMINHLGSVGSMLKLGKPSEELCKISQGEIQPYGVDLPHRVCHISTSYPLTSFDGCVFIDETHILPENHVHISYQDHRLIFLDQRLFKTIHEKILDNHQDISVSKI